MDGSDCLQCICIIHCGGCFLSAQGHLGLSGMDYMYEMAMWTHGVYTYVGISKISVQF